MRRLGRRIVLAAALVLLAVGSGEAAPRLEVLARVGPWPVAANLVAYRGRIWFSNAVRYRNHNSADLWSIAPAGGEPRFERRLFSQDAGVPLVDGGLLWWPYEDARFSIGFGHFAVTDGADWRFGVIPSARAFHTHAMAVVDGTLVAATSAWRAGLQVSADRGRTWRQLYDHPTPEGRVTRIVELVETEGILFAGLTRSEHGLLMVDGGTVGPVPGWPMGRPVLAIAAAGEEVVGLVRGEDGVGLWRTDGRRSARLDDPPPGSPRDVAALDGRLYLLTATEGGGTIWTREAGGRWSEAFALTGGRPDELALLGGRPFAAGAGGRAERRGVVWGEPRHGWTAGGDRPALPELGEVGPELDWEVAGGELDRLLADPASYGSRRTVVRDRIHALARAGPPPGFFAERLDDPRLAQELSLIGGNVRIDAESYARWLLLFGMSVAGAGRVPPPLLDLPFEEPPNPAEKYFSTLPAALATVGMLGQDDRATVTRLIERLEGAGEDPLWLRHDVAGALAAVTGRQFGADPAAWRSWWREGRRLE